MSDINLKPTLNITSQQPVNTTESTQLDQSKAENAPTDPSNISVGTQETAEDNQKTETTKPETAGIRKHIVTYVASGIWVDAHGDKWARNPISGTDIKETREYTDDEYKDRHDIEFMVGYNSMKVTTVSL